MNRFMYPLWSFCILLLCLNHCATASSIADWWNTAESRSENGTTRIARGVDAPAPIDCKLKSWSSWTPCGLCKEKTFRFQYLEQAAQFGGTQCMRSQWTEKACPAGGVCTRQNTCGESFTCKETGRCVSEQVRCNGEADCEDSTDEADCEETDNVRDDKCTTLNLFPIPGSERAVQGYNILTGDFVQPSLDPVYNGGVCEYVYNGEWRKLTYDAYCENLYYNDDEKYYRKPYNFLSYRFMAQAASDSSTEYYDDAASLLTARKEENSFNLGMTFAIYYVEAGVSGSSESMFLSNISQYTSQGLGFVRLVSTVQTAQFKMRTRDIMLYEDMYQSLMELPEEYDFGTYSRFLSHYGTHYITQGSMGGVLEYVVVVNKEDMEKSAVQGEDAGLCLGMSLGLSYGSEVTVGLTAKGNTCTKTGSFERSRESSSSFINDVIMLAKGGIASGSAGLLAIRDADTYRKWGKSLKYNPALIEFETLPVYELVRLSTAADQAKTRLPHLKRAWEEYLGQFNPCRCAPCLHNGKPVLTTTSCSCVCKEGYRGLACEETTRKGSTDGAWSCWGTWSSCLSGTRTRRRECNNPPPKEAPPCLGSSAQTQRC